MPLANVFPGMPYLPRRGLRHLGWLLLSLTVLLAWSPAGLGAPDQAVQTEYRIKTAFLYNFARFVTWPAMPDSEFTLCVLGGEALGEHTHSLLDKTVHERRLRILHLDGTAMVDQCQLVFIGSTYAGRLHEVLPALGNRPVLTVSDIDDFIAQGGMIGFRLVNNKVRFEINTGAAGSAGLAISSKLQALATTILSDRR